jgi:poly-gamma-glutamate synthesis protein (capsule biosynthesis protein)
VYALVAPFPTTLDGVSLDELKAAWYGSVVVPLPGARLWMTETTRNAFTSIWGESSPEAVVTVPADSLIDKMWQNLPAWGIVPFESLDPRLKVLTVDGQSPIRNVFDDDTYPLVISFGLTGAQPGNHLLPQTNREADKLTVLLMTGVTALVRATAVRMDYAGVEYPARDIGDTLREADITHISNEIPFYGGCPKPDSKQEGLVFCSNPRNIGLLDYIDADIIELTGNHFEDYGPQPTLQTLAMYDERQWPYYGGGSDLEDSRKPAFIEHNGNRIAFIGCNPVGPDFAWATEYRPGAARCGDYSWIKDEISRLKSWGYIVVTTFQYVEYYEKIPTQQHMEDFRAIADAGATIVNGSQAHVPQAMEFYSDAFIHYGLGNLFFDQMSNESRREFLDRHTFYDGRYISTELVTAMLEDYARPRLMTPAERKSFLDTMFSASGW